MGYLRFAKLLFCNKSEHCANDLGKRHRRFCSGNEINKNRGIAALCDAGSRTAKCFRKCCD